MCKLLDIHAIRSNCLGCIESVAQGRMIAGDFKTHRIIEMVAAQLES